MVDFSGFKKCKTDVERWKWVVDNKDSGFIILLDNDCTFMIDPSEEEGDSFDFDGYLGWSSGVVSLLESLGINCDSV